MANKGLLQYLFNITVIKPYCIMLLTSYHKTFPSHLLGRNVLMLFIEISLFVVLSNSPSLIFKIFKYQYPQGQLCLKAFSFLRMSHCLWMNRKGSHSVLKPLSRGHTLEQYHFPIMPEKSTKIHKRTKVGWDKLVFDSKKIVQFFLAKFKAAS